MIFFDFIILSCRFGGRKRRKTLITRCQDHKKIENFSFH